MRTRDKLAFAFLVGLGTLQMAADVVGATRVKGLAAALQVAPAMRVFTAHQGWETHAARFTVRWEAGGRSGVVALDPATYGNVAGPYNRRNVYGAALAYAPVLRADARTRPMQLSVVHYAFCTPGTMRAELGLPVDARRFVVDITPRRADARRDLERSFTVDCDA
jgi:hypothetical protein